MRQQAKTASGLIPGALLLGILLTACGPSRIPADEQVAKLSRAPAPASAEQPAPTDDDMARNQDECHRQVALSNLEGTYAKGLMAQCLKDRGLEPR